MGPVCMWHVHVACVACVPMRMCVFGVWPGHVHVHAPPQVRRVGDARAHA